ncbi:CvpA family protein [uncultured Oscillibacter sp.]|uniref:CvpA family protein n=1 Tax=uncultured Oscillibacter sp. TaxID=876091 RepID=UPI00262B3DF5|nr:CvpA family protein [uncultured Oscillibacter sp.]
MTTPVIIDAIAVAVLAGFAIWGAWKGLLRTLAGLLVVVISLAGAGIVASALSAPAAKLIAPAIEKRIESRLENAMEERRAEPGDDPEDALSVAELLELLGIDEVQRDALALRAQDTVRETGARMMTAVIESVARSMLYGVLYMLSFLLLSFALHLLVRMLDAVLRLPGLRGLNAVGGGLVGLAEGALLLFLAVWALRLVGVSFDGQEDCQIFRFFTAHTPLDALKFLGI